VQEKTYHVLDIRRTSEPNVCVRGRVLHGTCECFKRPATNIKISTVPGLIPAVLDTARRTLHYILYGERNTEIING